VLFQHGFADFYRLRSDSKRLFVADWSPHEIDEMFTLRAMLEGHAAARAAVRVTDAQLADLRAINRALEDAVERDPPDIDAFLRQNRSFHELILAAARSPRLSGILPSLVEQPVVHRTAHHYARAELDQSARDHRELVAAFEARDADWARSVMASHIRRAFHVFSNAAAEHPPGNGKGNGRGNGRG